VEDRAIFRQMVLFCNPGSKLSDGRIELSSSGDDLVSNDTLSLNIFAANSRHGGNPNTLSESSITINVASQLNNVLRSSGLAVGNGKIQAIWSSGDKDGMHLFFGVLSHERATAQAQGKEGQEFRDVTSNTSVLYAGKQHFDATTKTLTVCVSVANRGSEPLQTPLALEVRDIHSPLGSVSIQNASNGKTGPGAVWDLSGAITGTEIPPRSRSNPCCLVFHFDFPDHRKPDEIGSLLTLKLGVLTRKQ